MRVIYIDVLLTVNLIVNYFILLASAAVCKRRVPFYRTLLGSAVASGCTMVIFLPEIHWSLSLVVRFVISVAVTLVCFGYGSVSRFLAVLFSFYSVSFAYAGIILALWFLFRPSGVAVNNGAVYIDISPTVLLVSFAVSYFLIKLLRRYFGVDTKEKDIYELRLSLLGKSVSLRVLYDTGNSLRDMFCPLPVAVASFDSVKRLIPLQSQGFFAGDGDQLCEQMQSRFRLIPYSVVGGDGVLPAFKCDGARLVKGNKITKEFNCIVAVAREDFADGTDGLIGEEMIKLCWAK